MGEDGIVDHANGGAICPVAITDHCFAKVVRDLSIVDFLKTNCYVADCVHGLTTFIHDPVIAPNPLGFLES
ncbi:hypothetical protein RRU01S_13_00110 [Agrobacterium rubi TR3 = NBRC 13261]|uniref:Uncharacterized protein n=1 Tax=Agrobacterium rubi TR3 = NBRC 13261 TaxID=1368415 RepID=A0A081CVH7_9HYPH|nr:hypothetical protein RRU01S_13_00110 [Agrobacterium rubi TR3 = NBRC 13261]